MIGKRFCKHCKKKLPEPVFGFNMGEPVHEFEDGFYCDVCAKMTIEKRRKRK